LIELPLAYRSILALKPQPSSAILGTLICAGGYGQPILTGIRLYCFNTLIINTEDNNG